jgi:hypothetical protein
MNATRSEYERLADASRSTRRKLEAEYDRSPEGDRKEELETLIRGLCEREDRLREKGSECE